MVFAFSGDIASGQVSTVEWDTRLYEPVSNNVVIVGNETLVEDTLLADINIQMMGPFVEGDDDTEKVWVPHSTVTQTCRVR